MAMPKSVTKVKKDGIEFVSNVDRTQYSIAELSKAALRDVSKLLRRKMRDAVKPNKRTGNVHKNIASWVRVDRETKVPELFIGVYGAKKAKEKGLKDPFYAQFLEFGTSKMPAVNNGRGFVKSIVEENIDEIIKIQAQYLSAIEDEAKAIGLIEEGDFEDDD